MSTLNMTIARGHSSDEVKAMFSAEKTWVTGRTWIGKQTLFTLMDGCETEICHTLRQAFNDEVIDVGVYEWGKPGEVRRKYVLRRRIWHRFWFWKVRVV